MSFKITGLNEIEKKLKKMEQAANELDGTHEVPINELLTESFVSKFTKFTNAQELFDSSGFTIETPEDFAAIPDEEWDKYISEISDFDSWSNMLQSATVEFAKRKMGF